MKKIFVTLGIALVIFACNSGEEKKTEETAPEAAATPLLTTKRNMPKLSI